MYFKLILFRGFIGNTLGSHSFTNPCSAVLSYTGFNSLAEKSSWVELSYMGSKFLIIRAVLKNKFINRNMQNLMKSNEN